MMARILIDALGIDQPGGARTAVLEPLVRIAARRPAWRLFVALSGPERALAPFPNVEQIVLPARKGMRARLVAQVALPILAIRHRVDLVHFAKSQASFVPAPSIFTIFDTTTLSRPELHSRVAVWYWRIVQPHMARRAEVVTTLSHDAANEIERWLGVPADRVEVIPCGSRFGRNRRRRLPQKGPARALCHPFGGGSSPAAPAKPQTCCRLPAETGSRTGSPPFPPADVPKPGSIPQWAARSSMPLFGSFSRRAADPTISSRITSPTSQTVSPARAQPTDAPPSRPTAACR